MPREPFERPPRKTERVAIATVAPHACQDACTQTARVFLLPRVGKPRASTRAHKQERGMTRRHEKPTWRSGNAGAYRRSNRGREGRGGGAREIEASGRRRTQPWLCAASCASTGQTKPLERLVSWVVEHPFVFLQGRVLSRPREPGSCRNDRCGFHDASGEAARHSAKRTRPDETTPAHPRAFQAAKVEKPNTHQRTRRWYVLTREPRAHHPAREAVFFSLGAPSRAPRRRPWACHVRTRH